MWLCLCTVVCSSIVSWHERKIVKTLRWKCSYCLMNIRTEILTKMYLGQWTTNYLFIIFLMRADALIPLTNTRLWFQDSSSTMFHHTCCWEGFSITFKCLFIYFTFRYQERFYYSSENLCFYISHAVKFF